LTVKITPLPEFYRKYSRRLWPCHPPIFEGPPSPRDVKLAIELYKLLDEESQKWYYREGGIFDTPRRKRK